MKYFHLFLNRLSAFFSIIFCLPLYYGCIGDNLNGCDFGPFPVSLSFTHTLNESSRDLFTREVHHLDVYLYDNDGNFYKELNICCDTLRSGNCLDMVLPQGSYTAVIWGNANTSEYQCRDYTSHHENMRLDFVAGASSGMELTSDSLFHGIYPLRVGDSYREHHYLDLMKNTHDIRVLLKVINASSVVGVHDFAVEVKGTNGSHRHDNSPCDVEMSSVPRYALVGSDSIVSQVRTLRLQQGDDMRISIRDNTVPSQLFADRSLTDDLLTDPRIIIPEDLDRIHRYQLTYELVYDDQGDYIDLLLVNVGDWDEALINAPL